jgi:cytochrome d ubiquinol oxidase subunit I
LFTSSLFLRTCEWAAPIGFLAVLAGWFTTEVGRQPWTVYGLLRTADSVSPSLTTGNVALSLCGYVLAYVIMYWFGIRQMYRMALKGPARHSSEPHPVKAGRPEHPIYALPVTPPETPPIKSQS